MAASKHIDIMQYKVMHYLNNPARMIFEWGQNDCALFANDMLVETQGFKDVGIDFRGKYKTPLGAAKCIRKNGYEDVRDIAVKNLVEVDYPEAGDLVLHPNGESLGVCAGYYCYFVCEHNGYDKVLSLEIEQAWGTPCQQ